MKKSFLVLSVVLSFVSISQADQPAQTSLRYYLQYSCDAKISAASRSPVKGYNVKIYADRGSEAKQAVVTAVCPACMVEPKMFTVKESLVGTTVTYTSSNFRLQVILESFVPTKTHMAELNLKGVNGGRGIQAVCQVMR